MEAVPVLKISKRTNVASLKTAILKYLKEKGVVYLDAIGVNSNYIAIKAIIRTRGEIMICGKELDIIPTLKELKIEGTDAERTAVRWIISTRPGTV